MAGSNSSNTLDQQYDVYGVYQYGQSDCEVSNDPPFAGQAIASLKTCNITQYMCASASAAVVANKSNAGGATGHNSSNTVAIDVPYEYELLYNPEADLFHEVVPYLEEVILEHLAAIMGLSQCRRQSSRMRRQTQARGRFSGVSLEPRDTLNKRYTSCMAPNVTIEEGDKCIPMHGGVTVFVQLTEEERASQLVLLDDDKQTIRDSVSGYLRDAMDNNIFVVPTSIEKVVFIANSASNEAQDASVVEGASHQVGLVAGACGVLLLLAVLACCCLCYRKQKRRNVTRQSISVAREAEIVAPAIGGAPEEDIENSAYCLASFDSLALRANASEIDKPKCENDAESANTSRTSSVASVSIVREDVKDDTSNENENDCQERSGESEEDDESAMDEFDMLDRLALLPPPYSVTSRGGNSLQSQDFLSPSRSLSPDNWLSNHHACRESSISDVRIPNDRSCRESPIHSSSASTSDAAEANTPEAVVTGYSRDSFDEEIMGIISDDADYNYVPNELRTHPDVLDGHGAYLSDDSGNKTDVVSIGL